MKDTKKILRQAIYTALSGNVTYNSVAVPVYDEKAPSTNTADNYIILSTQQETDIENNDSAWITTSGIDIEVYNKTFNSASKDTVDDIYEDILEIILPSTQTIGITVPAGFEFQNAKRETANTQSVVLSDTETVIICRFRLVFTIVQK